MKPVAVVPTLCTLGNAFCGFLAIAKGADALAVLSTAGADPDPETLARSSSLVTTSCWLIFLAMVFDSLDGRIARMTRQTSDFGAALDSLTDAVTFGVAPALLLKFLFESNLHEQSWLFTPKVILMSTVLYVMCALLRLARFTVETEEQADAHDFFHGLPTPAAAGFLCASILFYITLRDADPPRVLIAIWGEESVTSAMFWMQKALLPSLALSAPVLGVLMISRVPYIHIVNRYMRGKRPYTYVAQTVFVLFLVVILEIWAIFPCFLLYVVLCPPLVRLDAIRGLRSESTRSPEA